eukprot:g32837.t1
MSKVLLGLDNPADGSRGEAVAATLAGAYICATRKWVLVVTFDAGMDASFTLKCPLAPWSFEDAARWRGPRHLALCCGLHLLPRVLFLMVRQHFRGILYPQLCLLCRALPKEADSVLHTESSATAD